MTFPRTLLAGALVLALVAGASRAGEEGSSPTNVAGVAPGVVDGDTARKLVASGIKVVDVRTPAEFATGHVPGALNIPHDQMAARHSEIGPPSTPVLLYCKSGRRTQLAANVLRDEGFSRIYDMQSIDVWTASEPKR
jgi:rhodanese-related sulfurtransferase